MRINQVHMFRPIALPPHPITTKPSTSHSSSPASFPILVVAVIGILATAFLLISYYIFVIKCCLNWHRFRYLNRFSGSRRRHQEDSIIIYATPSRNRGLDASVIRAIPIFRLKRLDEGEEKAFNECSVCLSEFQEDERLRFLPNCNHAFHIDCIDTWLQGNANCPLCRSSISNSIHFRIQDPRQTRNSLGGDVIIDIEDFGLDQAARSLVTGSRNSSAVPTPTRRVTTKKVSSKGDECIDVRRKVDEFCVKPIRRSFSMDSSADRQLYLSVQEILQQNPQFQEASGSCEGSSSSGSSSRLRISFFSFGNSRGSKNAILPVQDES